MAEVESSFHRQVAVDNSISFDNCSINFQHALSVLPHKRANKQDNPSIDTSIVLVIALAACTSFLVVFFACLVFKLVADRKRKSRESSRTSLQKREEQQLHKDTEASSSLTTAGNSSDVLVTESTFRNYDTV